MTDELKKLIFSPKISKVFTDNNWVINRDSKSKFHSFFIGDIADYYLNVHHENFKIYLQFTLDIEIPNNKINDLLILINIANQNSKDGFFVFDFFSNFAFKRLNSEFNFSCLSNKASKSSLLTIP